MALLATVGLLTLEVVALDDHFDAQLRALQAAGRSAATPEAGPPSPAVPRPPAPEANGPITGVDLRTMARCEPGATCPSRLQVWLQPWPQPRRVGWVFQVTDRCTGRVELVPGGAMDVGAGGTEVTVVRGIPLPVGRALAINAVLDVPARAASPTVLVPPEATC